MAGWAAAGHGEIRIGSPEKGGTLCPNYNQLAYAQYGATQAVRKQVVIVDPKKAAARR